MVTVGTDSIAPYSTAIEAPEPEVDLRLECEQAKAALDILSKAVRAEPIDDGDWNRLVATEAYVRLREREALVGNRWSDAEFRAFLLSADTKRQFLALKETLAAWTAIELASTASRVLSYLPLGARLRARLFPTIKPLSNSFVYGTNDDAMIFLHLDPSLRMAQVEATVAHELHHVGLFPFECRDVARQKLPPSVRHAVELMRAFREGFAMLAAAGGPDIHPRHVDGAAERHRWDREMAKVDGDLKTIEKLLLDVINGRLTPEQSERMAMDFFRCQGPWYTVGWRMAATVEETYGRAILTECMPDPRLVLFCYNSAIALASDGSREKEPAIWSGELMSALGVH